MQEKPYQKEYKNYPAAVKSRENRRKKKERKENTELYIDCLQKEKEWLKADIEKMENDRKLLKQYVSALKPESKQLEDILDLLKTEGNDVEEKPSNVTQRLNTNTANKLDIEQIVEDSEQVEKATVNEREAKRPLDLEGMIDGLTQEASNKKAVVKKIEEPKSKKEKTGVIWEPSIR